MEEHDYINYPELTNSQLETERFTSPHEQIENDFYATVVKVHDGDTLTLQVPFRDFNFPLRFLDIDAPELNAGGEASRDWLKGKIEGKDVQIKIDPKNRVEKYGRLLGRVFYLGMDLGQEEVYLGLAKPFTQREEGKIPAAEKLFSMKQWF
jgi:endonuclease YncB( thermonuclease family)